MQHEDGEAVQSREADEDVERETWLKQIALASLRAVDKFSGIQQVCHILMPLYCQVVPKQSARPEAITPDETPH